jgi:hypothetical protein
MPRTWIGIGPGRYVAEDAVLRYDCPHPKVLILHTADGAIELPPGDQPDLDLGAIIRALRGEAGPKGETKTRLKS